MTVVTRFAPSPTGYLHIGGARTALFNWLLARSTGGKFLLRIEDTDKERSTEKAVDAIFESLQWLGLDPDEPPVFQSRNIQRHQEIAKKLLDEGKAYRCFTTPEELDEMRAKARAKSLPPRYDGRWRDRDPAEAPEGTPFVVRFKSPLDGESIIHDLVQGEVTKSHKQLDDMVLLRADGTPTYMLSVVVDDHDMEITHVLRGDDHLTNAFRQLQLYLACDWIPPKFGHVPLIHGEDGGKLSKRHGALGAEAYRDMGFLPEAMRNYLLRLGWSHGDDEIISTRQAIEWFNVESIGRSPARFDVMKLTNLNGFYLRSTSDEKLVDHILPDLEATTGRSITDIEKKRLLLGMDGLKQRSKTLLDLASSAYFYVDMPPIQDKAQKFVTPESAEILKKILPIFEGDITDDPESLEATFRDAADKLDIKLGKIAQPLRVAITGNTVSPSMFEVITILGQETTQERIRNFVALCENQP